MADRVSTTIRIGGTLPLALLPALTRAIEDEAASIDWEGTSFSAESLDGDAPLVLMAHEVAWGQFGQLEQFCIDHQLCFARWSGGYAGSFGASRVLFDGTHDMHSFIASEDDEILISLDEVRRLGTISAIEDYFAVANAAIPPLTLTATDSNDGGGNG